MKEPLSTDRLKERLLSEPSVEEAERVGSPVAAVAIIIDSKRRGGSILLIGRTERRGDPWSGQIAFPGGRRAPEDQTFLETAIREAREEVGIDLREHEMLGVLPLVFARSRRIVVVPYVFQLKEAVTVQSNEEVEESFWAPISELAEIKLGKCKVRVEDSVRTVDCYVYHGYVIWGLTFRMINILLEREQTSDL